MPNIVLKDLHVKGFKGVKYLFFDKLVNINLLVGKSNSGKTTVLEAIKDMNDSVPVELISPCYLLDEKQQAQLLTKAITTGKKNDILELISNIDPDVVDIDVVSAGLYKNSIVVTHKDLGTLLLHSKDHSYSNGHDFSYGFRVMLAIALTTINLHQGVLLIDDFYMFTDPDVMSIFIPWLILHTKAQLFIATHSLEVISDFVYNSSDDNRLVLYRLLGLKTSNMVKAYQDRVHRVIHNMGLDIRY